MKQNDSKQMRVSKTQYETLGSLSKALGMSRVEVLNNAVALTKFLVDSKAVAVKAVQSDGHERELFLTLLLGNHSQTADSDE